MNICSAHRQLRNPSAHTHGKNTRKRDMDVTSDMDSCQRADNTAGMDLSPASLPRAATVLGATELHQKLHLRLPKKVGTPGHVLRHAIEVFEDLHSRRKPMSFKFGFTHDPVFSVVEPYLWVRALCAEVRKDGHPLCFQ